jgi:hypothetical protein
MDQSAFSSPIIVTLLLKTVSTKVRDAERDSRLRCVPDAPHFAAKSRADHSRWSIAWHLNLFWFPDEYLLDRGILLLGLLSGWLAKR